MWDRCGRITHGAGGGIADEPAGRPPDSRLLGAAGARRGQHPAGVGAADGRGRARGRRRDPDGPGRRRRGHRVLPVRAGPGGRRRRHGRGVQLGPAHLRDAPRQGDPEPPPLRLDPAAAVRPGERRALVPPTGPGRPGRARCERRAGLAGAGDGPRPDLHPDARRGRRVDGPGHLAVRLRLPCPAAAVAGRRGVPARAAARAGRHRGAARGTRADFLAGGQVVPLRGRLPDPPGHRRGHQHARCPAPDQARAPGLLARRDPDPVPAAAAYRGRCCGGGTRARRMRLGARHPAGTGPRVGAGCQCPRRSREC